MNDPPRMPRRQARTPTLRPEFTLLMLYFFAFFLFFALLLALPALVEGMRSLPPASSVEAERAAGAQIARQAVQGKLGYAFLAATVAAGIGSYARMLPGIRRRG